MTGNPTGEKIGRYMDWYSPPPARISDVPEPMHEHTLRVLDEAVPRSAQDAIGEWPSPPGGLHPALPIALDPHGNAIGSYYTVWFGTNRRPCNALHRNEGFQSETDDALHVGSCIVKVPYKHQRGSIGTPLLKRIFLLQEDDRIRVESIRCCGTDDFIEELRRQMSVDPTGRELLYVHGYNTTFEGAAIRAAQIGFDLSVTGVTAFFTWPSRGEMRDYIKDGDAVQTAEDYFVEFVQLLLGVPGVQSLDILAHSMGNQLLVRTIKALGELRVAQRAGPRIRHLLLAAPDVDIGKFEQTVEYYRSVPEKWTTVYTCRKDRALAASKFLRGTKRLGFEPPIYNTVGLDTVSASSLPLDWLGHGYFANVPSLIDDLRAIVEHNARPTDEKRHLLPVGGNPPRYWRLPLKA